MQIVIGGRDMALTIWKYKIPLTDEFSLDMPGDPQMLTVQVQPQQGIMLWALVDPRRSNQTRHFRLAGTGHPIDYEPHDLRFVGSFQLEEGALIFHLFEVLTGPF